jgi:hypothetical protein
LPNNTARGISGTAPLERVSAKTGEESLIGKAKMVNRHGRAKVATRKENLPIDH